MTSATKDFSLNEGKDEPPLLLIRHNQQLKRIRLSEIVYLESEGNQVNVITELGETFQVQKSLVQLERQLPTNLFIRIHKQYIVHLEKVEAISIGNRKVLTGQNELPLGRTYKERLMQHFEILG